MSREQCPSSGPATPAGVRRRQRNTGRGLAVAALVIDAVLLLGSLLVAVLAIRGDLDTGSEPSADRTGSVALSDLAAGDYPGDKELSKTALERCQGGARAYVTTRMPRHEADLDAARRVAAPGRTAGST